MARIRSRLERLERRVSKNQSVGCYVLYHHPGEPIEDALSRALESGVILHDTVIVAPKPLTEAEWQAQFSPSAD